MLTVCIGSEGGEDLELSSSEDEREKEERLGKELEQKDDNNNRKDEP